MFKFTEREAEGFIAEKKAKLESRWKQTIQLYYKNWGAFVPVINSIYTSAFYKHLWFFVKNVDLMEVYTQKVLDEFGHPCPPGHIQILIGTGKALGLTAEEV